MNPRTAIILLVGGGGMGGSGGWGRLGGPGGWDPRGPVVSGNTNLLIVMWLDKGLEEVDRPGTTWQIQDIDFDNQEAQLQLVAIKKVVNTLIWKLLKQRL
jgi:hypothetical protein